MPDETAAEEDNGEHALPPARELRFSDSVREGSRLAVGAVLLAGRGMSQMLRRFGPRDADETEKQTPPDVDLAAAPLFALSATRTILVGAIFETQRVVLAGADAVADRVGPAAAALWEAPLATSLRRPLEQRLGEWHLRGAAEEDRSRAYAATTLLGVTSVGMDFIVDNLDVDAIRKRLDVNDIVQSLALDELILQSTGGIAGEAIDTVRAQAVGVDSIIDRITSKVLRRPTRSDAASAQDGDGDGHEPDAT